MSSSPDSSYKARVAVVDDDDAVRDSLGFLLEAHQFETRLYRTGEDVLAAYDPDNVDCVLLDLNLPGINGLAVMANMRGETPDIPIVLMTALRTGQLKKAAHSAGAVTLLDKPVREGVLIEAVKTAIGAPCPPY